MKNPLMTVCLCLCMMAVYGQHSTNAAGGDASGGGGTVAYSIGQLFYTTASGNSGTAEQGVQHAFDVYAVSIEETIYSFSLKAYPNPTTDQLNLSVENFQAEQLKYRLTDLRGKLLLRKSIRTSQTLIPFKEQPAGAYFLHISLDNQPVQTFNIIKN
ncbi:MAG: T9SS type A sorting domain-containing protein [Bacteroidota bacterium]